MAKHIQIRNVPEDLHRLIKAKAALAGTSLSEFLLREIRRIAERPTLEEFRGLLKHRDPVDLPEGLTIVDILREERRRR